LMRFSSMRKRKKKKKKRKHESLFSLLNKEK
jgi:hypothetical protein